ncbi:MAG: DUF805 domain-containing protein, partial [Planctomycetaceae bacterium]|nr:DUF805 domain-containing protein [Planctomycetaceae bacterium]
MKWYLEVLRKYAVFSGRARRKEYWLFSIFNFLIAFAILIPARASIYVSPSSSLSICLSLT